MNPAAIDTMPIESLWTVKHVQTYLNIARSCVYDRVNSGDLPHLRVGNHLRFVPEQIRRWVLEKTKTAPRATVLPIGGRR